MLISLETNFLFIHVYKVAGTSIKESLGKYRYQPQKALINRLINKTLNKVLNQKIIIDPKGISPLLKKNSPHLKAYEIQEKIPKIFENTYKFAFVRNPYDWQVSLYHYMLKNKNHHFYEKMKELGSFGNYLKWLINENGFKLQSDFLLNRDQNELLVDYVSCSSSK